ncbi:MAG: 3'-5' exoribonuclease YhaM family protein [Bryobacteraceae bacterium]
MKDVYVGQLAPDQIVTTTFLVHGKDIRQKKSGEPYLSMSLGDRTGDIDAKMWDNVADVMTTFDRDDFVRAKGLVQIFHNRPQFTVHKIQRVDERQVDFADYFPASERDPGEMWRELRGVVAGMSNADLRALLDALLDDPEIARRYRAAPAAKHIHHAWLGGLLEHVLSLCGLCRMAATQYKSINLDLLLAGAVLHDIGKIHELSYDRGFGYTAEGQLLGHMVIALRMIGEKLPPAFPPRLRTLVEHMVISHHGQLEFGSPKLPQFPEALLLHYLDDLDSKMTSMRTLLDRDRQIEGDFTSFHASLDRSLLKSERYLAGPAKPPAPAEPASKPDTPFAEKLLGALAPSEPT